jgi:hypothetical protein
MRRSCGRSTSEIRWLRNDRLQGRRRNRLIWFHAGYYNQSFFQITDRFDLTAGPEHNSGAVITDAAQSAGIVN